MNYIKRILTKNKNENKNKKIVLITPVVSKVVKKKHFIPKNLKYNYKKKIKIIVPKINLKQLKLNSSFTHINSFINRNLLIPQELNNLIPFNAMKIITLINDFEKLPLGFHLFKSENLNLYISTQSNFSKENYFGVTFYQINKNEFYNKCTNKNYKLTLEDLSNVFSNPELRMSWDNSLYKFEIIKQLEFNNNDLNPKGHIQKQIFNSPVFGVSKREMIDKKIFIFFNNSLYSYQSGVNAAGHEWSCNFSTDVKFNSDEYFNLFSVTRDFICMKGDKNRRACFEKLLDYMSRHCDLDKTIDFMLRRCPYAAEIMMGSWNMPDRT